MFYSPTGGRVKIVETVSGSVTSTKQFIGSEERDGSGAVTKQFFSRGQRNGSTNVFFSKDHLGSVRALTDNSGVLQASFSFDPYGRSTKLEGSIDSDFGFTGTYIHARSGLSLTRFRAFNPFLGRWISRDPLAEGAGANMYQYSFASPVNFVDPLGLDVWIEGPGDYREPGFHESINVGDPSGDYYSQSYGLSTDGQGHVYTDDVHGGQISQYAKTTPEQDKMIKEELMKELGNKGSYDLKNQCISYSRKKFKEILDKYGLTTSRPPFRPLTIQHLIPYWPYPVIPSTSTSGSTATTVLK